MENLSKKHREVLKSFRYSVSDVLKPEHDDYFLLRWLKARNFNEEKAEAMLRKHLIWCKQNRIRNFLDHYRMLEVFDKFHPGGLIGNDKEGHPVWLLNTGVMDVKGFVQSSTRTDFTRYQIYRLERLLKATKDQSIKLNKPIEKNIYIMDEENLIVSNVMIKSVLESLLHTFSIFEANYPETLKKCFVINVPKPFFVLYSFIKPLLSEDTANKVKIFGTEGWKEALLEDIDASVLPVHWGGTRIIDGDPKCTSLVNPGGPIPEKYFLTKQPRLSQEPDVLTTVIQSREYKDIPVLITHQGSIIAWEVETEENDLGIGVFYQRSKDHELEEMVPVYRTETYRGVEDCSYECENPGAYFVRFDNTFSWFSSKKVTYRIKVYLDCNMKIPSIRA